MRLKKISKPSPLALLLGSTAIALASLYYILHHPNVIEPKRLKIPSGKSYNATLADISEGGYLKNGITFKIASRMFWGPKKIRRGFYLLTPGLSNWQILKILKQGLQKPIRLTISTAKSKEDLVEQISKKLDIKSEDLLALLTSKNFLYRYGFNPENILALFVGNTYEVYWTTSAKEFIDRMHHEYKIFWNKERLEKAHGLKLTPIEVAILASIVQLETNKLSEATTIAGVYMNRLKRGIPLCACPTIKHIIEGEKKVNRILKKDILINSEFNTYRRRGLPPGPLCLPDRRYVDAVLNYEKHAYLYFSSKEDFSGYHYFAKTLAEHNKNATRYRRKLTENRVFR